MPKAIPRADTLVPAATRRSREGPPSTLAVAARGAAEDASEGSAVTHARTSET